MDKGSGSKYKGKSLNEIDINPEVDLAESDCSDEYLEHDPATLVDNFKATSTQPSTSDKTTCKVKILF